MSLKLVIRSLNLERDVVRRAFEIVVENEQVVNAGNLRGVLKRLDVVEREGERDSGLVRRDHATHVGREKRHILVPVGVDESMRHGDFLADLQIDGVDIEVVRVANLGVKGIA